MTDRDQSVACTGVANGGIRGGYSRRLRRIQGTKVSLQVTAHLAERRKHPTNPGDYCASLTTTRKLPPVRVKLFSSFFLLTKAETKCSLAEIPCSDGFS